MLSVSAIDKLRKLIEKDSVSWGTCETSPEKITKKGIVQGIHVLYQSRPVSKQNDEKKKAILLWRKMNQDPKKFPNVLNLLSSTVNENSYSYICEYNPGKTVDPVHYNRSELFDAYLQVFVGYIELYQEYGLVPEAIPIRNILIRTFHHPVEFYIGKTKIVSNQLCQIYDFSYCDTVSPSKKAEGKLMITLLYLLFRFTENFPEERTAFLNHFSLPDLSLFKREELKEKEDLFSFPSTPSDLVKQVVWFFQKQTVFESTKPLSFLDPFSMKKKPRLREKEKKRERPANPFSVLVEE